MTKHEDRQRVKNEALNKIRKIYNKHYSFPYATYYDDSSYSEQRELVIRKIIEELDQTLINM